MKPVIEVGGAVVYHGNNLDVLPFLADNSVDSIVCDPPYELGFMGKKWDSTGIAYSVELWAECLRVLKPGGHLLAFGGSRTWHRLAVAVEDAGFELRDSIAWIYGSGFPKSLDISKAIDKASGAEREVVTRKEFDLFGEHEVEVSEMRTNEPSGLVSVGQGERTLTERKATLPATPEAVKWQGWGTALKPAFEPVVVARKPLIGTVAQNVLVWGVGGLNIDASRIGTGEGVVTFDRAKRKEDGNTYDLGTVTAMRESGQGRWPANVMFGHAEECSPTGQTIKNKTGAGKRTATFGTQETQSGGDGSGGWQGYEYETEVWSCVDGCPVKLLDQQSGISKSATANRGLRYSGSHGGLAGESKEYKEGTDGVRGHNDSGGASRFFYVAKANKRDRNEGLDNLEAQSIGAKGNGLGRTCATCGATTIDGCDCPDRTYVNPSRQNFHPTVKPTDLMRYLIKLVTPPEGVVLDPFTGSGSTGKAALLDGYRFIGIELTEEYLPIIEGRLTWAHENKNTESTLF